MKFSIKDFFGKYEQISIFLQILSHLLKKSLVENFIFRAVLTVASRQLIQLHPHQSVENWMISFAGIKLAF